MGNDNCDDQHFYLLAAACIGFLAGAIFLLLILVIVAATLWKCGIRLEKRGKLPPPTVESPQSPGEPAQPETHPNEAGPQSVPDENETAETRHNASIAAAAVCSRCSRSITTSSSSNRQSFRMLASLRRRSRKANSDPLNYSKQLHRRARCVSLGTELQRKRKLSDTVDFMAPCFFRRPGSLWTRVSADESIVYENDHVIVISRERQKHVCQLCGHKRPGPPAPQQPTRHSQQSAEPCAASTATHGTHGNAQRLSGRPAGEGTSKVKQHSRGRAVHPLRCVSGDCDMHELFAMGHVVDPLSGSVAGSSQEETLDDGDGNVGHERCLDCSELWSVESQEDAGSDADCCTDKPPVSRPTIDFIGHAVTSRGRALIYGRYPSAGKQD